MHLHPIVDEPGHLQLPHEKPSNIDWLYNLTNKHLHVILTVYIVANEMQQKNLRCISFATKSFSFVFLLY